MAVLLIEILFLFCPFRTSISWFFALPNYVPVLTSQVPMLEFLPSPKINADCCFDWWSVVLHKQGFRFCRSEQGTWSFLFLTLICCQIWGQNEIIWGLEESSQKGPCYQWCIFYTHPPTLRHSSIGALLRTENIPVTRLPLVPLSYPCVLHKYVNNSGGVAFLCPLCKFSFSPSPNVHRSSWSQLLSSGQWARN